MKKKLCQENGVGGGIFLSRVVRDELSLEVTLEQ